MSIKTILAPFSSIDEDRGLLETSFQLGGRYASHVVGLFLNDDRKTLTAETMSLSRSQLTKERPSLQADLVEWEAGRDPVLELARRVFSEVAGHHRAVTADEPFTGTDGPQVSAAFRAVNGRDDEALAETGRLFDVVVLRQPGRDADKAARRRPREILLGSGRPIILVPNPPPPSIGSRVLIAWNGSPRSARAANAARQYIEHADQVGILSVATKTKSKQSPEDFRNYLGWHGVRAEVLQPAQNGRPLGEAILAEAERFGCDLLVMGAYEQSSFRRSRTGGLTNHIMAEATMPVLMSH